METLKSKVQSDWSWSQMLGLDDNLVALSRVMRTGRLHPVLLLEGLEGIGKRHLAVSLAAGMLCQESSSHSFACGHCGSCREIIRGNHPDVAILNPEGESIKTADIEALQHHFTMMSPNGMRIGIIMNADRMTIEASNRALKTLEEPSDQVRIILTSSRPLIIPATVLGRCLRWKVKPPAKEAVLNWFQNLLKSTGRGSETALTINEWARRLRYSPGLIKRELDDSADHMSGIQSEVRQLLLAKAPGEVTLAAANLGRQYKAKVPEILSAVEWELNRTYRLYTNSDSSFDQVGSENVRRHLQRQLLRDIRRQAVFGKVTLNAQLVAESIGLCGWGAN